MVGWLDFGWFDFFGLIMVAMYGWILVAMYGWILVAMYGWILVAMYIQILVYTHRPLFDWCPGGQFLRVPAQTVGAVWFPGHSRQGHVFGVHGCCHQSTASEEQVSKSG